MKQYNRIWIAAAIIIAVALVCLAGRKVGYFNASDDEGNLTADKNNKNDDENLTADNNKSFNDSFNKTKYGTIRKFKKSTTRTSKNRKEISKQRRSRIRLSFRESLGRIGILLRGRIMMQLTISCMHGGSREMMLTKNPAVRRIMTLPHTTHTT